jgi:hypothetical protein
LALPHVIVPSGDVISAKFCTPFILRRGMVTDASKDKADIQDMKGSLT